MKDFRHLLLAAATLMTVTGFFSGCTKDINEDISKVLCSVCYENATDQGLHLDIYKYHGVDRETHKALDQKLFISLDIPARSQVYKDMWMSDFYDFYSSCITFDDGKTLRFEKEEVNENKVDRDNPASRSGYSFNLIDGIYKASYRFTDKHHSLAQ